MVRAVELTLIDTGGPRGAFEEPTETRTTVMAQKRSVKYNEFFAAHNAGLQPEVVFILSNYALYSRQMYVECEGVRYRVLRSYVNTEDSIELTCYREENQL